MKRSNDGFITEKEMRQTPFLLKMILSSLIFLSDKM
jgi:hypothetical protein